ncbi:MAG: hypothetical protein E4G90_01225, partial [Gemmatimonadales bacterium]
MMLILQGMTQLVRGQGVKDKSGHVGLQQEEGLSPGVIVRQRLTFHERNEGRRQVQGRLRDPQPHQRPHDEFHIPCAVLALDAVRHVRTEVLRRLDGHLHIPLERDADDGLDVAT